MLNSKSNSKKTLVTKNKLTSIYDHSASGNLMKRYKSQEVYLVTKKKNQSKLSKETSQTGVSSNDNTIVTSNAGHLGNKLGSVNIINLSSNLKFSRSKDFTTGTSSNNSHKSAISHKTSSSGKKKNMSPDSKIGSKMTTYINNKPKPIKKIPVVSKIMNDESIQELDTEENISVDETDERHMDEMKASEVVSDFYTNSIGEASCSVIDKGKKLINNLPKPFVKPLKTKFIDINLDQNVSLSPVKRTSKKDLMETPTHIKKSSKTVPKRGEVVEISLMSDKHENKQDVTEGNGGKGQNYQAVNPVIESTQRKLLISAKKGDRDTFLESLEIILSNPKGDINFKDDSGWTALHHACDEGNLKIVDILINTNANVNCRTNNKKTPLHLTTSHGYFDISKMLVENGCTINSVDDEKNTPIHICASTGHIELLKYLLDRFPQADVKNIYGKTPIDLAKKEDIKNLLQEYLKKNQSQYTKVHIHSANAKSVNNFLKNFPNHEYSLGGMNNNAVNINNYLTSTKTTSNNSQMIKTPVKTYNHPSNPHNTNANIHKLLKHNEGSAFSNKAHSKIQPNEYNTNKISSAFNTNNNSNNININISTNINHPSGHINVVSVNKDSTTKQIKINDKVKVTVETSNPPANNSHNKTLTKPTRSKPLLSHTNTSVKFNTYSANKGLSSKSNNQSKNLLTNINNTMLNNGNINNTSRNANVTPTGAKKDEVENVNNLSNNNISNVNIKLDDISPKKDTSRVYKIGQNALNSSSTGKDKKESNTSKIEIADFSNTKQHSFNNIEDFNADNRLDDHSGNNIDIGKSEYNNENNDNSRINSQSKNITNTNGTSGTNNKSNSDSIDGDSGINSYSMDEERVGPANFICHALLGKGSFGEVYLVEKRNTHTFYAMKVLSKDKIMGQNLIKYAMTERNVLSITNHPFIVKLNFSFQTSDKLFLILDYCPGGDLAEHLARENRFTEERAKIYLCEIILALEDLHKRDIIFRDLKPDNVVLDMEGHAQLTDFGLSKEGVLDSKSAKSFCGSIAYLAPEMLKRTGHGKAVDWYLLGVLFYEMLVGIPPYFTNNKEQLFKNIEKAELQIPKKFVSEGAESLLKALLQREPHLRLGSGKLDAYDVKNHYYFKDVNWDNVYNRKLQPPIPAFRNRAMQKFASPVVFKDNGNPGIFSLNSQMDSHFDGWSFINTEDQHSSLNQTTKFK